jgi:AmiR/NasT family two-component response regulator
MPESTSRRGLFVSGDLMLGTAVIGALSSVCTDVTRSLSGRGLLEKLKSQPVDLLVVDLEAEDLDLNGIGAITRESGRPLVVAYAPHVATDRMQAARSAEFAAVLTRGQAASQLAAVLAQLVAPTA